MKEATPLLPERGPWLGNCSPLVVRLFCCASGIGEGYDIAAWSGVLVRIEEEWGLASLQVGVLTAFVPTAIIFGFAIAGEMMDSYGRVPTIGFSFLSLMIGPAVMALSTGFWVMLAGRALLGVAFGIALCSVTTYVSEVAPAASRGYWGVLEDVFFNVGLVVGYVACYALFGVEHDWRWMCGLGCVCPAVCLAGVLGGVVPESPRYLLLHGREAEARAILTRMVGKEEAVETFELWKESKTTEKPSISALFSTPARKRQFYAALACSLANLGTGITIVMTMGSLLLHKMHDDASAAVFFQMLIGIAKLFVLAVVVFHMMDSYGRRTLMLWSAGLCALAHFVTAWSTFYDVGIRVTAACLVAFTCFHSLGLGPVSWVYLPEVFETEVRSKGVAICGGASRVIVVAYLLTFPSLMENFGPTPIFFVYGLVTAFFFVMVYLLCPETKTKKLEEVHLVFA
jgi:MFS family permease